ncbi:hypothetical protein [Acrocarpospora sp. B8E8]|uniref:hypothetical protein n=1 Tax=Acrocarpospora sp. B8E8 TaxID=3153572 RepID=UPI00325D6067
MRNPSIEAVHRRFDQGALVASVLVLWIWHAGVALPTGIIKVSPPGRALAVSLFVWTVYTVLGLILSVAVPRGAGRGPWLALVAVPVLFCGEVAVVLGASVDSFFDADNWPFNTIGWFALVCLWRRSFAELAGFFAVHLALGFGELAYLDGIDQVTVSRFVIYGISVCSIEITLFVGGRMLADIARQTAVTQDEIALTTTRRLAAEAVQRSRAHRYDTVRRTAAELLAELAGDRLDLSGPATGQRLRVAATRLRRLTVETDDVPDPLLQELRACADQAERRGVEVDLQAAVGAVPPLPVETRRALAEPIIAALAATVSRARVTVVAEPAEVVIAVVADARVRDLSRAPSPPGIEASYDTKGDLLWAQARWTGPSPSPS